MEQVLVQRLVSFYEPFAQLGITRDGYFASKWDPVTTYVRDPERFRLSSEWHYGRIEHFVRELREGRVLEPLEVDMSWSGASCTGIVLVDGHHRLCAADISELTAVPASCSGIVDIIDWLKGYHHNTPEF